MSDTTKNSHQDEEISLKELLIIIKDYFNEYLKSWKLIFLLGVIGAALFLAKSWMKHPTYKASITFMTNDDQGNNLGPLTGIISNFLPGSSGNEQSLDRIIELSKSKRILQSALFVKAKINKQDDFLANHLIRIYEYHDDWEKDTTGLKNFLFSKGDIDKFGKTELKVLSDLYGEVKGDSQSGEPGLLEAGFGKETSILKMSIKSRKDTLSIALLNAIYDKLGKFYIDKAIEKPLQTYKNIKTKTDSLKNELEQTEMLIANIKDSSRGIFTAASRIKEQRLTRKAKILTIAYGKAIENLEIADFSLKNETPFFQIIDAPNFPIKPAKASKIVAIIFGGFLGGFLALAFVTLRKLFRDTMQ